MIPKVIAQPTGGLSKEALLERLDGERMFSPQRVEEAEAAFRELVQGNLLVPVDFGELLDRLSKLAKPPDSAWRVFWEVVEDGGRRYFRLKEGDWKGMTASSPNDTFYQQLAGDLKEEETMMQHANARRTPLFLEVKRFMLNHPHVSIQFLLHRLGNDPHVGDEAANQIAKRSGELDPNRDFPFMTRSIKNARIRLLVAQSERASRDLLFELLHDSKKEIVAAARANLEQRQLATRIEILTAEMDHPHESVRADAMQRWPADAPFLPDLFGKPLFPLHVSGYRSDALGSVRYEEALAQTLQSVMQTTNWHYRADPYCQNSPPADYCVNYRPDLERELILLTHQFKMYGDCGGVSKPSPQRILCMVRAREAFPKAMATRDYHDLARLYYALKYGDSTLGGGDHAYTLATALRSIRGRGITNPRILVLGFSTIYSLENLAAILRLVGFKSAQLTALDISRKPLRIAQRKFGENIFGYPMDYVQADARSLQFASESFDLVATHLLLTHVEKRDSKREILEQARRVLKPNGEFVDEEIVVPPRVDRARYKGYYSTLADEYPDPDERCEVGKLMRILGGYSQFFPYQRDDDLRSDFQDSGFEMNLNDFHKIRLYDDVFVKSHRLGCRKVK